MRFKMAHINMLKKYFLHCALPQYFALLEHKKNLRLPTDLQWQIDSGEILQTFEGHSSDVRQVAFSPEGDILVSGSEDGTIKIWDGKTGRQIGNLEGHLKYVNSVTFSRDGKSLASGSSDNTIKIWRQE